MKYETWYRVAKNEARYARVDKDLDIAVLDNVIRHTAKMLVRPSRTWRGVAEREWKAKEKLEE